MNEKDSELFLEKWWSFPAGRRDTVCGLAEPRGVRMSCRVC